MKRWIFIVALMIGSIAKPLLAGTDTDDALRDIDAMAVPATAPTGVPLPDQDLHQWVGLIRFFAPGLLACAGIGIACSTTGILVVLRKESMLALALPQVVAVGTAIGLRWLGGQTLLPAAGAVALAMGLVVQQSPRRGGSTVVPALYIAGLSLSFLIIAHAGAHVEEMQNLFTGIDVAVTWYQALIVTPILLLAAILVCVNWRRWLLLAQSSAVAELAGLRPKRWDALFLFLMSLIVLLGTSTQGVVMVLAFLFLPAATVLGWSRRIPTALLAAGIVSLLFGGVAFVCSVECSWPFSQTVASVGALGCGLSLIGRRSLRA